MTDTYTSIKFDVRLTEPLGVAGTLEIWASVGESELVQLGLQGPKRFDGVGLAPAIAAELADMIERREQTLTVSAFDDYYAGSDPRRPVEVAGSCDTSGLDLALKLSDATVRMVIDGAEQPDLIAAAIRQCIAVLAASAASN